LGVQLPRQLGGALAHGGDGRWLENRRADQPDQGLAPIDDAGPAR